MQTLTRSTRREFLGSLTLAATEAAFAGAASAVGYFAPPIAVFSKVYQELKLGYEQAAELTAEAGLDGVDCPVRAGGEIEPERAEEEMPRYAEALAKHKKAMLLLTTGVLSPSSPHAERVLRTARKLKIRYYRMGAVAMGALEDGNRLVAKLRSGLKDLAQMNKELGLTAVYQNHSPGGRNGFLGGDLGQLYEMVGGFDPNQVGVVFDLGHALIVHGDEWPRHFERLRPYIKVAYVKDTLRLASGGGRFVRFGEGEFSRTDWFQRLKAIGYQAPLSMHIEFDWSAPGRVRNRAALLKALQDSVGALKGWLARA